MFVHKKSILILCLTHVLLLAFVFLIPAQAVPKQAKLSGQIEFNRVSPPAAGVKVLNEILDRVRSTPAFAMINKDQVKSSEENLPGLGISNYQLAIKPKESPHASASPAPIPMIALQSARNFQRAYGVDGASLQTVNEVRGTGIRYYNSKTQLALVNEDAIKASGDPDPKEKLRIALLPPNVATGVPSVHLGITQAEVGQSLKSWGGMREDVIGNWTVWSFHKRNTNQPAIQVFMRHGLVEALRIFDQELIGANLGVRLGDGVKVLKEQFGEPAFILSEPQPASGQNYVYPLSQAAFLLSRDNPKSDPAVASLLIFDVK